MLNVVIGKNDNVSCPMSFVLNFGKNGFEEERYEKVQDGKRIGAGSLTLD